MGLILAVCIQGGLIYIAIQTLTRPVDHPVEYLKHINITRAEYEQEYAKWQAQHVEEYEITLEMKYGFGGTSMLHVSEYGKKIEEIGPYARPTGTLTQDDIDFLTTLTIEGMFAEVDYLLRDAEHPEQTTGSSAQVESRLFSAVDFNTALGFPQHTIIVNSGWDDSRHDYQVTNLKIIKQNK